MRKTKEFNPFGIGIEDERDEYKLHCPLNHREPDTPLPALSKEEKKRNRPSIVSLPNFSKNCLTVNLRLPYANPTILQVLNDKR
ncbi:MAG: hypothetical protein DDG59_00565 [Anaerolineae bacterium]|jgi:hypothetical protein|nr:MAG: hypothetical protein DDG59_00565 [Anaerolineae bacterium]